MGIFICEPKYNFQLWATILSRNFDLEQVKLWFYKLPAAWGGNFGCKAKEQQKESRKHKYQFKKKSKKLAKKLQNCLIFKI